MIKKKKQWQPNSPNLDSPCRYRVWGVMHKVFLKLHTSEAKNQFLN